jgi:hypothetical protein
MKPMLVVKFAFLACLLLATGCSSNNKGKLEGTKWVNVAGKIKVKGVDQDLPGGLIKLEFRTDGTFAFAYPGETRTGKYSLGFGDYVTMNFDKALEGQREHRQKIIVNGDTLALIDSDGTTLNFSKQK